MSACALAKNSDIGLAVGAAFAELEAARMAKVMKDAIKINAYVLLSAALELCARSV
jgi:hypothetical protein